MGCTTNSNLLRLGENLAWNNFGTLHRLDAIFLYIPYFLERLFFHDVDEAIFSPGPLSIRRTNGTFIVVIVLYDLKPKPKSYFDRQCKKTTLAVLSRSLNACLRRVFGKVSVVFHLKPLVDVDALFVLNYFKLRLLQKFSVMQTVGAIHRLLSPVKGVKGYRIDITGRYGKQQRASKLTVRRGNVTLSTFSVGITYVEDYVILKHGKCGFKVWLNRLPGISSLGVVFN